MRLLVNGIQEYNRIEDIPEFEDGVSIILFYYPQTPDYYYKPYIDECIKTWKRNINKPIRFIMVYIDNEVMNLSKWSQHCNGNRKYITDSLRVYFVNKFDRCLYLDTDVVITSSFDINKAMEENDNFVINHCTGTCLWNKHKNSEVLNKFFEFYEKELSTKEPFHSFGDIKAYDSFTKTNQLKSINVSNTEVAHMSYFYPWIRDKENIVISMQPWTREENTSYDIIRFPIESFWAFMLYCYDKKYFYPIVLKADPKADKIITFT